MAEKTKNKTHRILKKNKIGYAQTDICDKKPDYPILAKCIISVQTDKLVGQSLRILKLLMSF